MHANILFLVHIAGPDTITILKHKNTYRLCQVLGFILAREVMCRLYSGIFVAFGDGDFASNQVQVTVGEPIILRIGHKAKWGEEKLSLVLHEHQYFSFQLFVLLDAGKVDCASSYESTASHEIPYVIILAQVYDNLRGVGLKSVYQSDFARIESLVSYYWVLNRPVIIKDSPCRLWRA